MKLAHTAELAVKDFEALFEQLQSELSIDLFEKLVDAHRKNVALFVVMEQINGFLIEKLVDNEVSNKLLQ